MASLLFADIDIFELKPLNGQSAFRRFDPQATASLPLPAYRLTLGFHLLPRVREPTLNILGEMSPATRLPGEPFLLLLRGEPEIPGREEANSFGGRFVGAFKD